MDNAMGSPLAIGFAVVGGVVVLMRLFASQVYDVLICNMTKKWYAAVIDRLDKKAKVIDIGIGTAEALLRNKQQVVEKELSFVGVDYEPGYVATAKSKVAAANLADRVTLHCASIFDKDLGSIVKKKDEEPFDAAYFSGSWTLMPNPVQALRIGASFVKDDGFIYITQTFQREAPFMFATMKPLLKYITTVDFGTLHFETNLNDYIKEAERPVDGIKLELVENGIVPGSIDNRWQSARLVVFKKTKAN